MTLSYRFSLTLLSLLAFLAACRAPTPTPTPAPTSTPAPSVTPVPTPTPVVEPPVLPYDLPKVDVLTPTVPLNSMYLFGYTYQQADGNRYVEGQGRGGTPVRVDLALEGDPAWITAAPLDGGGSLWAVVLEDGRVQGFILRAGSVTPVGIPPGQLPPGMPPLLRVARGVPSLIVPPIPSASMLTHPVVVGNDPTRLAFIDGNGDLVLWENQELGRLPLDVPLDARILQDEHHRLLVLSGATGRYPHNVLGDGVEAESLSLIQTEPSFELLWTAPMPEGKVIEGLSPLWVDLDHNGIREILVTASDDQTGAQLLLFDENGARIAAGAAIGRGFRWRHQLVAAPFEPQADWLLADVLTPHIGGVVEFSQWVEDRLEVRLLLEGYSSHRLGSRNLDMAFAADVNGDGVAELIVPSEEMDRLAAVQYAGETAVVVWTISLGGQLLTNLAGVTLQDGSLAFGAGVEGGLLKVWTP